MSVHIQVTKMNDETPKHPIGWTTTEDGEHIPDSPQKLEDYSNGPSFWLQALDADGKILVNIPSRYINSPTVAMDQMLKEIYNALTAPSNWSAVRTQEVRLRWIRTNDA